jgi:hypothetical protein
MLLEGLAALGNFIKRIQDIIFRGAQPEPSAFEKSEKSRRDHNYCKWHWPGAARLISWSPICILRWTMHSRPRNHFGTLEIVHKKPNYIGCSIMRSKSLHCSTYGFINRIRIVILIESTTYMVSITYCQSYQSEHACLLGWLVGGANVEPMNRAGFALYFFLHSNCLSRRKILIDSHCYII